MKIQMILKNKIKIYIKEVIMKIKVDENHKVPHFKSQHQTFAA